ncbi:hypothetical protein [Melaminivora sp.]|uniref:hypothetical protein n=1 Tax=Melaminivora sp. TaxID=1933032 RepID=UPI0028AA309A|nr:hypothetical protein [Melaminivora sp.]
MAAKHLPTPTPEQQQVLDRILVQRERLRARREAYQQTRAIVQARAGLNPADPLPQRLIAFTRLHPAVVGVAAALAAVAGPRRLIRWSGALLPLLAKLRR